MGAPQLFAAGPTTGGTPVGGSGTVGTIPVWGTTTTTLGDSIVKQTGSNLGVNLGANPAISRLQLLVPNSGGVPTSADWMATFSADALYRSGFGFQFAAGGAASNRIVCFVSNGTTTGQTAVWTADGAGNVGIGTASPVSGGLTVYGASNGQVFVQNSSGHTRLLQNSTDFYIDGNVSGSAGSIVFRRSSSTLESMRIDSSGNVILNTANTGATIQAAGSQQGLKLPATPGNADTQTLDAYQENGSWTPTLAGFGGTAPTVTSARWTRVGRMVFCELLLNSTGTFSSTAGTTTVSAPATAAVEAAVPTNFSGGNSGVGAQSGSTVYLPTVASSTLARITWQFSV
jgi:hypothetical protein